MDSVIYGIVIVQESLLTTEEKKAKGARQMTWRMVTQDAEFFGRVSDLNVNLWGFHFQTTKKENVRPLFFRLLLRA